MYHSLQNPFAYSQSSQQSLQMRRLRDLFKFAVPILGSPYLILGPRLWLQLHSTFDYLWSKLQLMLELYGIWGINPPPPNSPTCSLKFTYNFWLTYTLVLTGSLTDDSQLTHDFACYMYYMLYSYNKLSQRRNIIKKIIRKIQFSLKKSAYKWTLCW